MTKAALTGFPLPLLILSLLFLADPLRAQSPIPDPVADYLAMDVPDRVTNVGRLLVVKRVEVDLAHDGKQEVFVGTWYRNSGPDTWLWMGYLPIEGGYKRITDSDVLIDFNNIYVGDLPETGKHGMAQAYSLELPNSERSQSNMISDLSLYYLEDGKLVQQSTGPLDLNDPEQKARFDFFFGPNRKADAAPKIESFTVQELAQRGYRIPVWRRP